MEMPFGGTQASDTFETGTRAAAWGGTTTIVDFVVQSHGQHVQDQVALWHEKAAGQLRHRLRASTRSSATSTTTSLKAMDELIDEGITSFKLFMAYPGVFLSDDGQILRAMQTAAGNGGLIMMHAENGSAIDVLVQQALDARRDRAVLPRHHPAVADRAGGDAPRDHARRPDRRAALRRARVGQAGAGPDRRGPRRRAERLRRDLPAVPLPVAGGATRRARASRGPSGSARRRCARAPRGTRTSCGSTSAPATSPTVSTDHCPFCMKDQKEHGHRQLLQDPQRHRLGRAPDGPAVPGRGRRADHRWSAGSTSAATTPARMFGLYGRRASSPRRGRRHRRLRPERAHLDRASARPTT